GGLDDVVGASDDERRERLADERLDERHVVNLHLLLAASRGYLGQAEALDLVLGGGILPLGVARPQGRASAPAHRRRLLALLDGLTVEVLDHGRKVDFHVQSLLAGPTLTSDGYCCSFSATDCWH